MLKITSNLKCIHYSGFGTFGKSAAAFAATPIDSDPEDTNEEDTKAMSAVMGISSFGRKAQNFDIIVTNWFNVLDKL